MVRTRIAIAGLVISLLAALSVAAFGASAGAGSGTPDPGNFDQPVANPYFPLEPGTVFHYRGSEEGRVLHERLTVTDRTKVIQGITTTVVSDILFANGHLAEKTSDWYANDNDGNVWYFGEATATYDAHGHVVSTDGSWEAGVDGAVAGTIMPADPQPTNAYRQEFYRGQAEDQAWVVQRGVRVRVPFGKLDKVVRTFEWTRLEPRVVSGKFYAPGLGIVMERDVAGGDEFIQLVRVDAP